METKTARGGVDMADIRRLAWGRHLRSTPTAYVRHLRRGRVVHEGTGLSFWFRPLSAVLSEVPVDDRELPLMFHARTADFQDVTVQASVTFRVTDPVLATTRIDFSIHPDTGAWRATPLEQVAGMLVEAARQNALELLATMPLSQGLVDGVAGVQQRVAAALATDARLSETGLQVIGVRVVAIRPEADLEKALQMPTRELVQQEADRATFERRALAVERERAIRENEMQSEIELARRQESLVAQQGANERRRAEEQAAASAIQTEAEAGREQRLAGAKAEALRMLGEAKGTAEAAFLNAYHDVENATLLGLAARELAMNLPNIQSLIVTPDLLAPVLARLGAITGADEDHDPAAR
jgi:regulator of protease activity HflC (stomatin/prohibitin superfamily)